MVIRNRIQIALEISPVVFLDGAQNINFLPMEYSWLSQSPIRSLFTPCAPTCFKKHIQHLLEASHIQSPLPTPIPSAPFCWYVMPRFRTRRHAASATASDRIKGSTDGGCQRPLNTMCHVRKWLRCYRARYFHT